MADEMQQVKIN